MEVLFRRSGFVIPPVREIISSTEVLGDQGAKVVKIGISLVAKFGPKVTLAEVDAIQYIAEQTDIPVPMVHASFRCRNEGFIIMDHIEGCSLDKIWNGLSESEKGGLAADLKAYMNRLRQIPPESYIGGIGTKPVPDFILDGADRRGPFEKESDFNRALLNAYTSRLNNHLAPTLLGMLDAHSHKITFCHGDFSPRNIMVHNGRVAGILDWEYAGWYPEYWEYCKALYTVSWKNDWAKYVGEILCPYYCEYAVDSMLREVLF
jgi:aminoglycoside phosphotransferase